MQVEIVLSELNTSKDLKNPNGKNVRNNKHPNKDQLLKKLAVYTQSTKDN
jgi:hypothetical protein